MKFKSFSLYAIILIILGGLMSFLILSRPVESEISGLKNENQISAPRSSSVASISKGTILLLLAVGVIGALGIGRKKEDKLNNRQNNVIFQERDHQDLKEGRQKTEPGTGS
jgi:hypothetical protein